jgi:hypothetical protein
VIEKTYIVVINVSEGSATPFFKTLEQRDMKWAENGGANEKPMQRVLNNRQERNLQKYIIIYGEIKPK